MYLQITAKCNMKCDHCCYSCGKNGKHADFNTVVDMLSFARDYTECISIGGGEPTLHPRFFDILKHCLEDFDYVWMATNGSQTDTMYRLANIIDQEDYPECDCAEHYTQEEIEDYQDNYGGCFCDEKSTDDSIYQEDKLSVALSLDCFHDPINEQIENMWKKRANKHGPTHFEIRDVTNSHSGIIAQGRAKRTGSGWNKKDCVCADILLKPDGKIKLCGCKGSPVIGDIWNGIEDKWQKVINENEGYQGTNCFKDIDK